MFDGALADEWAFTPGRIRFTRSVRVLGIVGTALVALAIFLAFRFVAGPTAVEAEVLGISEVRSDTADRPVRAMASFEIVNGELDGSALVDMTIDEVRSQDVHGLEGKTLRLDIAPGGRLVSLTGLSEGLRLDPATGAPTLMSSLSGQRIATSLRWTALIELRLAG